MTLLNRKHTADITTKKKLYKKARIDCKTAREKYKLSLGNLIKTGIVDIHGKCTSGIKEGQYVRSIDNFDAPIKNEACVMSFWSEMPVREQGDPAGFDFTWQCEYFGTSENPCKEKDCKFYNDYSTQNDAFEEYKKIWEIKRAARKDWVHALCAVKAYFL